ncbi:hypothetical protein BOTBODRAFT_52551 [Botryobasidium botryosum FD-172 SS1]|uniref:Uncharacterized protein n=1 Tax=Botryobasidium botryosum (strain FD-172 SS1) TaxID=930990 RepID=A0A067N340_BOTB1|nr:hypothetical protein BOTBODRAFT_52551 [Botryobasidium botryosum FD-172 SS1]
MDSDRLPRQVRAPTRVRRGGGGETPVTVPVSEVPTAPPSSTYHGPEIDGSEGAFIGLIVGLGILFIGSCILVFVLLRRSRSRGGDTLKSRGFPMPLGQSKSRRGWVQTDDGEEEEMTPSHKHSESVDTATDHSKGPYGHHQSSSASTIQLSAGPYPDAFSARMSTDSMDPYHDKEPTRSPTSPFRDGTKFRESI